MLRYVHLFQTAANDKQYWNKWITSDVWMDIIKMKFNISDTISSSLKHQVPAVVSD